MLAFDNIRIYSEIYGIIQGQHDEWCAVLNIPNQRRVVFLLGSSKATGPLKRTPDLTENAKERAESEKTLKANREFEEKTLVI